jgi:hypothetical protein
MPYSHSYHTILTLIPHSLSYHTHTHTHIILTPTLISYHTIPHHTIPYHTIPYHTIPYHTIPYHTILTLILYHIITSNSNHTITLCLQISSCLLSTLAITLYTSATLQLCNSNHSHNHNHSQYY